MSGWRWLVFNPNPEDRTRTHAHAIPPRLYDAVMDDLPLRRQEDPVRNLLQGERAAGGVPAQRRCQGTAAGDEGSRFRHRLRMLSRTAVEASRCRRTDGWTYRMVVWSDACPRIRCMVRGSTSRSFSSLAMVCR